MATMRGFGKVFTRAFHATPVVPAKHSKRRLEHILRNTPPYPYPIKHTFKQSWFGLYGGKHIQFGNNVPESEYKTRRRWLPNVRQKKLYSKALKQLVDLSVTASVLRTIDKVGGLDAYLLGSKPARLRELGPTGWKLRWRVINTPAIKAQLEEERKQLGLEPSFEESSEMANAMSALTMDAIPEGGLGQDPEDGLDEDDMFPEESTVNDAARELMDRIERQKGIQKALESEGGSGVEEKPEAEKEPEVEKEFVYVKKPEVKEEQRKWNKGW